MPPSSTIVKTLQIINARITFRKAPIHLLEKFILKDHDIAYKTLIEKARLKECIILQTCNRVEVFASGKNPDEKALVKGWAEMVGMSVQDFENIIEINRGKDVALHLMKLASGLDSLVLGEDQILGQIKRAYEYSRKNQYSATDLSILFDRAIKVGGKVRTATGVNKGSVSVGSMAVNLAEEYFDNLHGKNIMLIGSGEGATLVAKALKKRDVNFMVTSRTFDRAKSFADTVAGTPVTFERALEILSEIDIIFVSTTAPYYLVTRDRIEKAMVNRKNGLMIFDLSNPRTVEETVSEIKRVKLINMDQLAEVVEKNMRLRKNEIQSAERIIDTEMKSFDSILKRKQAEPVVISIFKTVDMIRQRELKKALAILGNRVGPEETKVIEQLSHAIVEGILSAPMNNLRREVAIDNDNEQEIMNIVAKLFKYEEKQQ